MLQGEEDPVFETGMEGPFSAATGVMGDQSLAATFPTTCSENIGCKWLLPHAIQVSITASLSFFMLRFCFRVTVITGLKGCGIHAGLLPAVGRSHTYPRGETARSAEVYLV